MLSNELESEKVSCYEDAKQALQMFSVAQCGVAAAVADSVKEGVILMDEATKTAIRPAVAGLPGTKEVIEQALTAHHTLAPHDYKQEKVNKPREAA